MISGFLGCTQLGPVLDLKSQQKRLALAKQAARAVLTAANHSCDVPSSARMPDFAVVKAEDGRAHRCEGDG